MREGERRGREGRGEMRERLTPAILLKLQHEALSTDTPHGVAVLNIAQQQFLLEEGARGGVADLSRVQEPRTMDPGIPTAYTQGSCEDHVRIM